MKIEKTYIINKETSCILPAKEIDYDLIVVGEKKLLFIRQTPREIIKKSCIYYWSTYEGRKKAVIHHTGFKQKVPIPINEQIPIATFPTHALIHINCAWLMYHHIVDYIPARKTTITFTNGKSLTIVVTIKAFISQMKQALEVVQRMRAGWI